MLGNGDSIFIHDGQSLFTLQLLLAVNSQQQLSTRVTTSVSRNGRELFGTEMNNTSTNTSGFVWHDKDKNLKYSLMTVMAALVCIANGTAVLLFLKNPRLRTAPNYFLFSLSISDLSAGLLLIPLGIARNEVYPFWDVQAAYFFMDGLISFSTAYHVTITTLDRYVAILCPLKHHLLTKKTAKVIVVSVWVMAISFTSIQLHWDLTKNATFMIENEFWWNIFRLVVLFGLPYPVMIYAFTRTFTAILKRRKKRLSDLRYCRNKKTQQRNQECKPVVIFLLMALLFAGCWLPWFVTAFPNLWLFYPDSYIILMLRFLTPITNPLLYTFLKQDFNIALRQTAHCLPNSCCKVSFSSTC